MCQQPVNQAVTVEVVAALAVASRRFSPTRVKRVRVWMAR